jgi:hypothetical protein
MISPCRVGNLANVNGTREAEQRSPRRQCRRRTEKEKRGKFDSGGDRQVLVCLSPLLAPVIVLAGQYTHRHIDIDLQVFHRQSGGLDAVRAQGFLDILGGALVDAPLEMTLALVEPGNFVHTQVTHVSLHPYVDRSIFLRLLVGNFSWRQELLRARTSGRASG